MSFEEDVKNSKLVAPDVDSLLCCFNRGFVNPTSSTAALLVSTEPLFRLLAPLAPISDDGEVKALWLRIPRGTIEDYDAYEELKEWGEVATYEEYEARWHEKYPEEYSWYRLVVVQSYEHDGTLRYYGVDLGYKTIVSALTKDRPFDAPAGYYEEMAACKICSLILPAVEESLALLKAGDYNTLVEASLPYQYRVGVIRRRDLWEADCEAKAWAFDGLKEKTVQTFRELIGSGANSADRIGRIREFTANDFFRACQMGYERIGKDCAGQSPSELYLRYADGRDEGLTGKGHGLNAGPGIDFDDPKAWEEWYFHRSQRGGHPWEVVPGGNTTHVELYVMSDKRELEWDLRTGAITEAEYEQKTEDAGYYFVIAGTHRQFEAVSFYIALTSAGLPVVIRDADELLARFDATDWVGVVPHHLFTRYCERLFPEECGSIIDFTHVYKEEDAWFESVVWLPEKEAKFLV